MKTNKILLIAILLLAALLRFWKLNDYPALNADESAIGYNAYSLIQTGMDEHGNSWPIHFQSFNDYKPGLYFYLVLPFVKFSGLNEWAVRIPSATLGVLSVWAIYLLVNELFGSKMANSQWLIDKKNKLIINHESLAISASFLLAISPWHIHFSRGGWEVRVATFFITLGLYFFVKAIRKSNLLLFALCSLLFALSFYTYHAARIVVPLLGIGLLVIYRDSIKKNVKNVALAGLVGLVALLPLIKDFTRPEISSRAAGVGLFADPGPLSRVNEQRGEHGDYTSIQAKLLHNKAVNYSLAFLDNWSEHYHGLFLFLSGDDIQRNKVPETGQMYLFDILFLTLGVVFLLKSKILNPKSRNLILWWLLVAPTASALTFQSPHALRSQNMVIPLTIIGAVGFSYILKWLKLNITSKSLLTTYYILLATVIFWNFARYQHMYWIHMAKEYPFSSQYGVKELVAYVNENKDKYENIIVTDRYDQPYILFLFYLKYPPDMFQKEHELTARDKFGFSTVRAFDRFEFRSIEWDTDQPTNPNSLIIGTDEEIPDEANIVKEIYGTNGYKYFQVVAN